MLEMKTAEELRDPGLVARWDARRTARQGDVLRAILREFVAGGGPVSLEAIAVAAPDRPPESVREAARALDEQDLIQMRDGRVEIAYPFSARPTPFVVDLPDGQERYACCAIDALGMAPMLRQRLSVRSRCHHCGMPIGLSVHPDGPAPGAEAVTVWIGKRQSEERRIVSSL